MTVYLVSNNLVLENIFYETADGLLEKRINRPLSIKGEKAAREVCSLIDADVIYSSAYASALDAAKYYADFKKIEINVNSDLNDAVIGKMNGKNIQMLRFMQERNFDFKFNEGESLNDVSKRMKKVVLNILKQNEGHNIVIFTHKRALLGFLMPYLSSGYNLEERLILSYNDEVIIDDVNHDVDIIRLDIENNEFKNIEVLL